MKLELGPELETEPEPVLELEVKSKLGPELKLDFFLEPEPKTKT